MDVAVTPDTYSPSVNERGDYVDYVPSIIHGIYCPCNSRKGQVYSTKTKFKIHCKSKAHQKWLHEMNLNRKNHFIELIHAKELVENQKMIINQMEDKISKQSRTIDYLTEELLKYKNTANTYNQSVDLLGIDE